MKYVYASRTGNVESLIGKFAMVDIVDTQNWFLKGNLVSIL